VARDEIIEQLRRARDDGQSAVAIAELLGRLDPRGLTDATVIFGFKVAFPEIPLQTIQDACQWHRVSRGRLTDDEFNEMLSAWLGPARRES